jgi:glyoxylase-like metal-dependent hydrolase (beta-lactamase superfamily II)
MEIIPNVHLIPNGFVNAYLIVDPDGLTLIDAGMARNGKAILDYIAGLGRSPGDLRRILVTHADPDHVGALAALKAASGARIACAPAEAEAIAAGRSSREIKPGLLLKPLFGLVSLFFKTVPATVDDLLADGQVLPVLGGLRVMATPGHTPGHVSLFAPAAGILFSGDSLISQGDRLYLSRPANTWDAALAQASARAQAALGATIVCPGHGPVVTDAAGKFPAM